MREEDPVAIDWEPAAADEVEAAAEYYEEQREGLSEGLFADLRRTLDAIRIRPLSFPRVLDVPDGLVIRRALLHRFPFAVIFLELSPDAVRVVAFAPARKRPGYWLWRVD